MQFSVSQKNNNTEANPAEKARSQFWSGVVSLGFAIWGTIVVINNQEANGECGDIWAFCFLYVIACYISFLNGLAACFKGEPINYFAWIPLAVALALTIWTYIIWVNETPDSCRDFYNDNYYGLWIFYEVTFWMNVALLSFLGLLLLIYSCIGCFAFIGQ